MEKSNYKYNTDKDLLDDFIKSFKPFFDSYTINKKAFLLQCINFVIIIFIINVIIGNSIDKIFFVDLDDEGFLTTKLFIYLVLIIIAGMLKDSKFIKWQTIFEMSYHLTKEWFKRFIFILVVATALKCVYNNYQKE